MSKFYQPSGRFSSSAFVTLFLLSFLFLPIFATIYVFFVRLLPYFNFVFVGIFGISISFVTMMAIALGKVRNTKVALLMGFLACFFAYYFHWVVWVVSVHNDHLAGGNMFAQAFNLMVDPDNLLHHISTINDKGTWSLSNSRGTIVWRKPKPVSGGFLGFLWFIEFLIIFGVGMISSWKEAYKPFDEDREDWVEPEDLPVMQFIEDVDSVSSDLNRGRCDAIAKIGVGLNGEEEDHSLFKLYLGVNGKNYLTIKNVKKTKNAKGRVEFITHKIVDLISVNQELVSVLKGKETGIESSS